ncbi:MAG: hypothetical protein RI101_12260 [Nitrospira sp.]|nr:hypothetical protein [Nitrospira sp.]
MALPIICSECGIHNSPENRWCECGHELDKVQKLPSVPPAAIATEQKNYTAPRSSLFQRIIEYETQDWVALKSYVVAHWRGDLPLGLSFWVNYLGINVLAYFIFVKCIDSVLAENSLLHAQLRLVVLYFSSFLLSPWQIIGLWRSAQNHLLMKRPAFWARCAQASCIFIGASVFWSSLSIFEWTGMVFRDSGYKYTVTVIHHPQDDFDEIVVSGFMGPGIADKVKDELANTPKAFIVTLELVGGLLQQAEKIGELIEKRQLATYTGTQCDSACTYAFMAGSSRILHSDGRLGFHAFQWIGPDWFNMNNSQANEGGTAYFRKRGVRPKFIEKAFSVPGTDMWHPSVEELIDAGVVTHTYDGSKFVDRR